MARGVGHSPPHRGRRSPGALICRYELDANRSMLYRAADQVVPIEIAAGVEIVSEGEPAEHLFVLLDGQVEVTGRAGAPSPCSDDWRHPPASLTETVRVRIATSWAADHFDGP